MNCEYLILFSLRDPRVMRVTINRIPIYRTLPVFLEKLLKESVGVSGGTKKKKARRSQIA